MSHSYSPAEDVADDVEGEDADAHRDVRRRQRHDEEVRRDLRRGSGFILPNLKRGLIFRRRILNPSTYQSVI